MTATPRWDNTSAAMRYSRGASRRRGTNIVLMKGAFMPGQTLPRPRLSPPAAMVISAFVIAAAALFDRGTPPFNAVAVVFGAGIAAAVTLRVLYGPPAALLRPALTALSTLQTASSA